MSIEKQFETAVKPTMNMFKAPRARGLVLPLILGVFGCGAPVEAGNEEGEIGEASSAFSEASCATATPNFTPHGIALLNTQLQTPTTYNNDNCYKSYVISEPGLVDGSGYNEWFAWVMWGDMRVRTKSECVGSEINLEIFASEGYQAGPFKAKSIWRNGQCYYGVINIEGLARERWSAAAGSDQNRLTASPDEDQVFTSYMTGAYGGYDSLDSEETRVVIPTLRGHRDPMVVMTARSPGLVATQSVKTAFARDSCACPWYNN